jgi:hypothetical protein
MSPAQTELAATPVVVTEPFWSYAADWSATTARTDTPDLMGLFGTASGRVFSPDEEERILTHPDVVAGIEGSLDALDSWTQTL